MKKQKGTGKQVSKQMLRQWRSRNYEAPWHTRPPSSSQSSGPSRSSPTGPGSSSEPRGASWPFGDRNRMAGDPQAPRRSRWSLSLAGGWTFSVALLLRRRSKLQGWRVVTVETQGLDLEKKFCWSKKMCCHSPSTIKADWALPAVSRNRIVKVTLEKKS